jgi:hypothetical protein
LIVVFPPTAIAVAAVAFVALPLLSLLPLPLLVWCMPGGSKTCKKEQN